MIKTVALILTTFATVTQTHGQGLDPCNDECQHGATCVEGSANFSNHTTLLNGSLPIHHHTDINGFHCECPYGWTGLRCDTVFESCSLYDGAAGHNCYNGGQCIPGLLDKYGIEQLFCDCSEARDENNIPYVGKYCEQRPLNYCADGFNFCLNDGECNYVNGETHCLCSGGFEGPNCEFEAGSVPICDIECVNGGKCVLGEPSVEEAADTYNFWDAQEGLDFNDYMYCSCPPGYTGPLCEIKSEQCGENQCFHGSKCIGEGDGEKDNFCDCSTATTDTVSYAGRFCQYPATSYCTKSGDVFCVNGGSCKANVQEGCDCPSGFHGLSCEFRVQGSFENNLLTADHNSFYNPQSGHDIDQGVDTDHNNFYNPQSDYDLNQGDDVSNNDQYMVHIDSFAVHKDNASFTGNDAGYVMCTGLHCERESDLLYEGTDTEPEIGEKTEQGLKIDSHPLSTQPYLSPRTLAIVILVVSLIAVTVGILVTIALTFKKKKIKSIIMENDNFYPRGSYYGDGSPERISLAAARDTVVDPIPTRFESSRDHAIAPRTLSQHSEASGSMLTDMAPSDWTPEANTSGRTMQEDGKSLDPVELV